MGEWNDRWDESHSAFGSLVPLKRICYPHLLQHRALRCAIAPSASVFLFDFVLPRSIRSSPTSRARYFDYFVSVSKPFADSNCV